MKSFKTHLGEIVKGKKLKMALASVASDLVELAYAIHKENDYAEHISKEAKDAILIDSIKNAERIKNPEKIKHELWLFQRLNTKLTGECIGILRR